MSGCPPVVPLRLLVEPVEPAEQDDVDPATTAQDEEGRHAPALALAETLQLLVQTIVDALGFGIAVLNLVDDDGSLYVAAVAGPEQTRRTLLGMRQSQESWHLLLDASESWGGLCFLDHRTAPEDPADVFMWVPEMRVTGDDLLAWHPLDALFAPLQASDGSLLGVLSVDLPADGQRPSRATNAALEAFGVTAALAIEHAALGERLRHSEHLFRAVFASSPIAIALCDAQARVVAVNDAYCRLLDRPEQDLLLRTVLDSRPDDELSVMTAAMIRDGQALGAVEERYVRPDGTVVWGRVHLARLLGEHGDAEVVAQVEDITEQKQAEARLRHDALHDALTRLPNRTLILDRLAVALSDARATGRLVAVLFCDLDRLKHVNDSHGHAVGDEYIRAVGRRLEVSVRPRDTVGRLSGDEFVIVCPDLTGPTEAVGLAGRVIDVVRQPLRVGAIALSPSVSIGLTYSDGRDVTPDQVLMDADAALYQAKAAGRGSWQVFDASLRGSASRKLELRGQLPAAVEAGELALHHQPVVRLADRAVVGHEALLRWQSPVHGLLLPDDFLDVVLDTDLESRVTDWALHQACRDAAARPAASWVSVNTSPLQVLREDLPATVERALQASGLPPERLVLEVPEDRLLVGVEGLVALARLRALGVRLALGGFGTGYAGLGAVQTLPLDLLKADQRFTAGLPGEPTSRAVVRAVVDLAAAAGLDAVVEGVETEEQAAALRELDVVLAQGYLFGRPQPV